MDDYKQTDNIFSDMCGIIEAAQKSAYNSVNIALIKRNWLIGHRIAEESLKGAGRAEYGANVISKLSKELTSKYGKGYTKSNLYTFYSFYKTYPQIFQTPSGKSDILLSWSHYAILLQVKMMLHVHGIRMKLCNKLGASAPFNEIYLLNITIEY